MMGQTDTVVVNQEIDWPVGTFLGLVVPGEEKKHHALGRLAAPVQVGQPLVLLGESEQIEVKTAPIVRMVPVDHTCWRIETTEGERYEIFRLKSDHVPMSTLTEQLRQLRQQARLSAQALDDSNLWRDYLRQSLRAGKLDEIWQTMAREFLVRFGELGREIGTLQRQEQEQQAVSVIELYDQMLQKAKEQQTARSEWQQALEKAYRQVDDLVATGGDAAAWTQAKTELVAVLQEGNKQEEAELATQWLDELAITDAEETKRGWHYWCEDVLYPLAPPMSELTWRLLDYGPKLLSSKSQRVEALITGLLASWQSREILKNRVRAS